MDNLHKALVSAQGKMKNPAFDKVNSHFNGYRYASLSAHIDAVRASLAAVGIAVVQKVGSTDDGRCLTLTTALVHESGSREESTIAVPMPGKPQEIMSLVTYLRRAQVAALCFVAGDDDDDGNVAEAAKPREIEPAELERRMEAVKAKHGVEKALEGGRKSPVRVEGVVAKVFENSTKTGKTVYKVQLEDGQRLTAWGDCEGIEHLIVGNRYEFRGTVKSGQYGEEFTVKSFEALAAAGGEDIPF